MNIAWSDDQKTWNPIGPNSIFMKCDYGDWRTQKRIVSPYLFKDENNIWQCIWSLNSDEAAFAHAASTDLLYWGRQTYPTLPININFQMPEVTFDKSTKLYRITWLSIHGNDTVVYGNTTKDFKTYSTPIRLSVKCRLNNRKLITILGQQETGIVLKVSREQLDKLIQKQKQSEINGKIANENYRHDKFHTEGLKSIDASLKANVADTKKISDKLVGIFFEDLNYAADGGLYAELIQNRDFEYKLSDKMGRDKTWKSDKAWSFKGTNGTFSIDSVEPLHPNNPHYARLDIHGNGNILTNEGFNGIAVKEGEKYDFSLFAKCYDKSFGKLSIRLVAKNGEIVGNADLNTQSTNWSKLATVIIAKKTVSDAHLEIEPLTKGQIALDMISLFPQNTFKGHKNGLRRDLAQAIADIKPRFMRFPGGCVAHGDGLDNIYRWKNTIGPLESRKPERNIWNYHQSMGLGYFEYLQFCEDIGAEPVPIIAAGVPCQNSVVGGQGQQGGIPMCQMDNFIQDILDLVEYCNGDITTTWGKKRAEAGHPKPFNLKYIGIGNEDLVSDIFEERFTMIFNVLKQKHPEITVIGTAGPNVEGADYTEGWAIAKKLGVPIVDEHNYAKPGWFINHQDFYDNYDRNSSKVYLGEYASKSNQLYNALVEALFLTALERNGDIVSMASYAPLLAKRDFIKWDPDMVYFNNTEISLTTNYYVQKLFGNNLGDLYIKNELQISTGDDYLKKRIVASVVKDKNTGDLIVKLVNVLPVDVKTQIQLENYSGFNGLAKQTTYSGQPHILEALPVTDNVNVSNQFSTTLPPYSLRIIRLSSK